MCLLLPGLLPALWGPLSLFQPPSTLSPWGASGPGWVPLLPDVCQAAGRDLRQEACLRQSAGAGMRLQCQLPGGAGRVRWCVGSPFKAGSGAIHHLNNNGHWMKSQKDIGCYTFGRSECQITARSKLAVMSRKS